MQPSSMLVGILLCAGALPSAHADIYAFTDGDGGVHYSNVPTDPRFVRVMAEPALAASGTHAAATRGQDWRRRESTYAGLIDEAAHRAALQPALLRAVVAVESAFDPKAQSPKGAQGLMQLLPATAQRYDVRRPFDPADNLRGGAHYLGDLMRRYGNDMELALAAYNAGEDAIDRHGGRIPPYAETRAYVPAVLKLYRQFLAAPQLAWYAGTLLPAT